ncbi:MAG: UDP-glucose--hexose-1-phosphate uridylyltransferase [Clostridia bacterium]|nr:UDP-glucose--hexose-1-phosphate uridylyltransferase [Clostridia bacterium]
MTVSSAIKSLVKYAEKEGLIEALDERWAINRILEILGMDSIETDAEVFEDVKLEELLKILLDYACENGICEDSVVYRDLLDTKIMGVLTPRPSQVISKFNALYAESPEKATEYYYHLSRKSDYIREYRVKNDIKWVTTTDYGDIDITINLSKPEKDPKAIAAALKMKQSSYPLCLLCPENEGYAGRVNHPARQNHRIIPVDLNGEEWCLQYSPYVYYNEHSIVFNSKHVPMKISEDGFRRLFAFVKKVPHYFVGSNADLPIVGGSVLTHDHFQGGNYTFAMTKAEIETPVVFKDFSDIEAGIIKWPMSVLRLKGDDTDRICTLAGKILAKWRSYTDEEAFIFAETDGVPHNTITPIARFRNGKYELDLVLRNNITTEEYPDGVYHPHPEHHHIKKENIGLIEVMGLAVLPARLKTEMALLENALVNGEDISSDERIAKHTQWAEKIKENNNITPENCGKIIRDEIGKVFADILSQCGVFERTENGKKQFLKFIEYVNNN